jgi:hypothetical protein
MKPKPKSGSPFENDPLFLEVLAEGLAIQDRFSAEPVYAKTGKGYLKSVGVEEIAQAKKTTRNNQP